MPGEFTELKTRIADYLKGLESFSGADVLLAFTGARREFPLKNPVITVEIAAAELCSAGLGGYLGGESPQYGASASVTLGFSFYCREAGECGGYFEALCDALFNMAELSVKKISREKTLYDAEKAAYRADAQAALSAVWVRRTPGERLFTDSVLIKKDVMD